MFLLIHLSFFLVLSAQSTVFHTVRESNSICGNSVLKFAPLPSGPFGAWTPHVYYWVSVASPPSNGRIVGIEPGAALPVSDTRDATLVYAPNPDFSGVDTFALTVSRINYGVDWTLNNYAVVAVHTVQVLPMPSVPVLDTSTLAVRDPDGPSVVQRYGLLVDGCGNDSVHFEASPATFRQRVVERVCDSAKVTATVRAFVFFGDKPLLSAFCPEYETKVAAISTYVDVPAFDWVVPNITREFLDADRNSTSNYTLVQDARGDLGYMQVSDDRVVSFVHKDSTSFSSASLDTCNAREYSLVRVSTTTPASVFITPDAVWQICVPDKQRPPYAFPLRVRHVWAGVPTRFTVIVADFNDDTFGADDGEVSQFAFKNSIDAGVVFAQTNFTHSAIFEHDCVTPLFPDTVYETHSGFCYLASGEAPEEATFVVATDGAGDQSAATPIEFEASIVVAVCDASQANSGVAFPENECTSKGLETNSKFGRREIPISMEVYVFPAQERATQIQQLVVVVDTLPRHGTLYDPSGNIVVTGARYSMATPLVYVGNPDYFNYAVISAVVESGSAEEFEVFTDMKGAPFDGCASETGCPDSFTFSYEHRTRTGVVGSGRFDVYVRAVGSAPVFVKNEEPPTTRDDPYQYANRYDSNVPVRIGKPYYHPRLRRTIVNDILYQDPDGDLWEAELMITTVQSYIGDMKLATETFNLVLTGIDMDCKVEADNSTRFCGGVFVLRGLPSDIKAFLAQELWFYSWPSTGGDTADEPVFFTLAKRYMQEGTTPLMFITNGNKEKLQLVENTLLECLIKKRNQYYVTNTPIDIEPVTIPPGSTFMELLSARNVPIQSEATIGIRGFFGTAPLVLGTSSFEIDEPSLKSEYSCILINYELVRLVEEVKLKAASFGSNPAYACAALYDTVGPSSVESIFTDDVRDNQRVDGYTVGPYVVEYLFKWKGWRGAPYPPLVLLPPQPPPADFWVMLGDALFAGAISDPSPENIALAVVGIFMLLLPAPPLAAFGTTAMRSLPKIGPVARSPALSGIRGALVSASAKGIGRKKTSRAKAWRRDDVFEFVVTAGTRFKSVARAVAGVFKSRASSVLAAAKNRIRGSRPVAYLNQLVTRLGNKFSRPSLNGLRRPKVPPRPPKPARPSSVNSNLDRRNLEFPPLAIPKPNLITRILNRIPSPKGVSLRLSQKYAKSLRRRKQNRLREQKRARMEKAKKKNKDKNKDKGNDKDKSRTKRGRTRKRRERRKQRTKRKKELRSKSSKAKLGKGIPRPRPKKAKPKSKFLPFAFALNLLSSLVSWIGYAFYLVMWVTYHVSQWVWERVFEEEEEEEGDSDDSDSDSESDDEEKKPLTVKQ